MAKVKDTLQELRLMSEEQLNSRISDLNEKRRELEFQTRGDEVRDVHELQKLKKDIARAMTILKEKRK